ncbi:hypothetical protein C8K18_12336 [Paraburkholderia sp. GV068]|nr:hypothetical protein C8K19_12336 [Paraburkholderia sp. GV072]PUA94294.1 hypothetical protein C8K18_12336 [Paraburkholderia sp. GV068]
MPPNGVPHVRIATSSARFLRGQNSDVSAIAQGTAPPRPRPATKRNAMSSLIESTHTVARLKSENMIVHTISTALRPLQSAMGPRPNAPTIMPNRPAPNTGPKADLGAPHNVASTGAA